MLSRKRRGFTLAEALVLVVIVATNTGMLALGLGKVHDAATCAKNQPGAKVPAAPKSVPNRLMAHNWRP